MRRKPNSHYFDLYLDYCKMKQTPGSLDTTRSCIKVFGQWLDKKDIHILDVDEDELEAYLRYMREERKVTISTQKTSFSAISGLFKRLMRKGHISLTQNPALAVREDMLKGYKNGQNNDAQKFRVVTTDQMRKLMRSTIDPRDRAVMMLLAKTGIRRGELLTIDLDDIDWANQSIELKPKAKRTNKSVYFDDEAAWALKRWLKQRMTMKTDGEDGERALFLNNRGQRLGRNGIECIVNNCASRIGLHDPTSRRKKDRFSPHVFRHYFTTVLLEEPNPMRREYVQELRGDSNRSAIDIYHHIPPEKLRDEYRRCMPRLLI